MGLMIREQGGKTAFIAMPDAQGAIICTKEFFPDKFDEAVAQKARWFTGIALAGWDRMGWHGSIRECWMRLHDRRSLLSALIILASYISLFGGAVVSIASWSGQTVPPLPLWTQIALKAVVALMLWRLANRAFWTMHIYGGRQGLLSIPRIFVANCITIAAMYRAIDKYSKHLRGEALVWEKTDHHFPDDNPTISSAEPHAPAPVAVVAG